jgi:anti-sigma factor RsiW
MTADRCAEMQLLLQADCDGELDVAGAAALAAHLAHCPDCAARQLAMTGLSARLRSELPYHTAPARLRQAIEAAVAASGASQPPASPRGAAARRRWLSFAGRWLDRAIPFAAGLAVAASLAWVIVLPRGGAFTDGVVASHIRALQPGHLIDVVSTDQHTVKPWFDGRLDFAPPVRDLAADGFPLAGGRLDYLGGRAVAVLVYRRALHVIDLYVWPSSARIGPPPGSGERNGYNYMTWTQDGMVFWAVSDVNGTDLRRFADRWRAAS